VVALLLYRVPPLGMVWVAIVAVRLAQFVRLGARTPACLHVRAATDVESPRDIISGAAPATPAAAATAATAAAAQCASGSANASLPARASASPSTAPLGRVLLVGNGPSIRERGLGSDIDGFDTVVRFNSFVTKGLEEHTGSKTSLWCHMMQWYHIGTVEIAQKAAWLPTCYAWNHVVLAPLIFVPNYLMPMLPPPSAITWSVGTYWRAHRALGLRPHQVPTTGFVMLTRLLETVERIHIVGFDGFGIGKS